MVSFVISLWMDSLLGWQSNHALIISQTMAMPKTHLTAVTKTSVSLGFRVGRIIRFLMRRKTLRRMVQRICAKRMSRT